MVASALARRRDGRVDVDFTRRHGLSRRAPAGEMKFADGERTLEQIVASLLKHQDHQVAAIAAGLS